MGVELEDSTLTHTHTHIYVSSAHHTILKYILYCTSYNTHQLSISMYHCSDEGHLIPLLHSMVTPLYPLHCHPPYIIPLSCPYPTPRSRPLSHSTVRPPIPFHCHAPTPLHGHALYPTPLSDPLSHSTVMPVPTPLSCPYPPH